MKQRSAASIASPTRPIMMMIGVDRKDGLHSTSTMHNVFKQQLVSTQSEFYWQVTTAID